MRKLHVLLYTACLGAALLFRASGDAQSLSLQAGTPGTPQTGNFNISGTGIVGTLNGGTIKGAVLDKGGAVFDVKAYGAAGDGSTDDTSAINSAISAAQGTSPGGGTVYFPSGTYKITSTLTLNSGSVTLQGAGPLASTLQISSQSADMIAIGNTTTPIAPGGGVRDLTLSSSGNRTGGYAVTIDGASQGILDNLRITATGNGIRFSPTGHTAVLWFVTRSVIETTGAFDAIDIEDGNDNHFVDLWIEGNSTSGSNGINITNGTGFFANVDVVKYETGIKIAPGNGQTVGWATFNNVLADTNTLYGWNLAGSGNIWGLECVACWAGSNGTSTINGRGMALSNGSGLLFVNPRVLNNGGHGIEVSSGVSDLEITGGLVSGNSYASSGTAHGIILTSVSGFRITGIRSGQSAGRGNSQGWGLVINTGCSNFVVTNTDTRTNATGGLSNSSGTSATKILQNNI